MINTCKLNNKSIRGLRHEQMYQAIIIDLTLAGIITQETCEMLLGGGIPTGLTLPDGSTNLLKKPENSEDEE